MLLVGMQDFNASIDSKSFFIKLYNANKKHSKNLSKYQETIIIQQETCRVKLIISPKILQIY